MVIMKKIFFTIICFSIIGTSFGQKKEVKEIKYRRSSLEVILFESDDYPKKDTVIAAYNKAPFPDKYNNHSIEVQPLNPKKYPVTEEEMVAAGIKKTQKDIALGNLPEAGLIIDKYLKENKIANKMIAKWFNRAEDGSFDMNLIGERGMYDASQIDISVANNTVRGTAALADAGEDLIKNTFLVVSKLKFVDNEVAASISREIAIASASLISNSLIRDATIKSANMAYEKAKEGYSVWTSAYLYQLEWNDSIASVFYNNMWVNKSNIDSQKVAAFDSTNLFKLKFIGKEKASSLVTYSLKKGEGQRTDIEVIELATIRNIDAVYAKLQKEYDVFKTKTPLYTGYPITAKIGLKEGINAGDKFEILEQLLDEETGKITYKQKGVIKVDKKNIWDNRYSADENKEAQLDENGKPVEFTTFKGGKKYYSGMLIRQLK